MSEQIREQVSAFLDGELPNTETELLLKRLTRDGELRESFGRYALIGEAVRGAGPHILTRGFASRVNVAIDGEPGVAVRAAASRRGIRWWRPLAGVAVAAGVAAVAIVALQQRAIAPGLRITSPVAAQNSAAPPSMGGLQNAALTQGGGVVREALSYTVPGASAGMPGLSPRLTNYMFAHSKYSSVLGQRGVLADLLIEDDEPQLAPLQRVAQPSLAPETRVAP
ncbi:MAG: sigma-E factor negative regulatory protein RseA [Gammaproteobacteria bacterium]|jgi:sigma-E factor negative regulatory protein RseA|nr:sigma-E factor negative regulatory protein RseA [Gammaproteobacteria bacterium]